MLTRICDTLYALMNLIVRLSLYTVVIGFSHGRVEIEENVLICMNDAIPHYPHNPTEWHKWIEDKMGITKTEGIGLFSNNSFPVKQLEERWHEEFKTENGYSPDFVPALLRNITGFLSWIYADRSEPNWRMSDC